MYVDNIDNDVATIMIIIHIFSERSLRSADRILSFFFFFLLFDISGHFIVTVFLLEGDKFPIASHPQFFTLAVRDGLEYFFVLFRGKFFGFFLIDLLLDPLPVESDFVEKFLTMDRKISFVLESSLIIHPIMQGISLKIRLLLLRTFIEVFNIHKRSRNFSCAEGGRWGGIGGRVGRGSRGSVSLAGTEGGDCSFPEEERSSSSSSQTGSGLEG